MTGPGVGTGELDDGVLVEVVAQAEQATSTLAALQARASVAYRSSQIARQRALGLPRKDLGRGAADEIALRFVEISQQHECVTPWCDAPIRHVHHVQSYAHGGTTVRANAAGTCERFNYTLEMPGWKTQRLAGDTLRITTPAGRTYDTSPPPLRPAPAPALTPRSSPP